MPSFVPNHYMLEKHEDKGQFDWEIYAWCLRDAIAKTSNLSYCDYQIRDMLEYSKFMYGKTDSIIFRGKTYSAKPIKE